MAKGAFSLRILLFSFGFLFLSCSNHLTGYVNPTKLLEGYHGAIAKQQTYINQLRIWQQNLDSLAAETKAITAELTKRAKEQQLQQYREAIQQKAVAEQQRLDKETLDEINAYLKQYGKEKGYDFILGATEQGNIVYAAEGKDITEEVLTGLNQQYDRQHPTHP
ncbi:OmpH family outer membrane protein [Hymenobacter cavernae]|uniref:OmpH family outer membrane protein n=1 Tax=Hymenobacter cavernae TaxID=2044852 RepID=UPI00166C09EE|nr:OmpH family outer membrane protein [Hymenobacter cavernae]